MFNYAGVAEIYYVILEDFVTNLSNLGMVGGTPKAPYYHKFGF